jgi:hypothetical protein
MADSWLASQLYFIAHIICSFTLKWYNHLNFMDLPLILNPAFSRRIRLFGEVDELDLLLKTSATMIDFFDEIN